MQTVDQKKIIKDSKERCKKLGIDPLSIPTFTHRLTSMELMEKLKDYQLVIKAGTVIANNIKEFNGGHPFAILITDNEGYLLDVNGKSFDSLLKQLSVLIGVKFSEEDSGTNSISLALEYNMPFSLSANEHYHTFLQAAACYTVPFSDYHSHKPVGTITIMTEKKYHSPLFIGFLREIAKSLEREMIMQRMF